MGRISGQRVQAWWFNPRDGQTYGADGIPAPIPFGEFAAEATYTFTAPTSGVEDDWVLVLDSVEREFGRPGVGESQPA
jgi:hypothetical protein